MPVKKEDKTEKKSFKIEKLDKGEGSAVIAMLNVKDLDGDVTLPGAFGEQHVNLIAAHNYQMPRIGKAVIKEQDDMAIGEFIFNLDDDAQFAREWYSALKFDMEKGEPLQEWSYGFRVIESDMGDFNGERVRFLKSLDVIEISPVLRGAGIGTATLTLKNRKTFKDEMEIAIASLAEVRSFIKRSQSLAELRAKDGREISDAKRDGLKSLSDSLAELQRACEEVSSRGEKDSGAIQKLYVEYEKIRHNFAGV